MSNMSKLKKAKDTAYDLFTLLCMTFFMLHAWFLAWVGSGVVWLNHILVAVTSAFEMLLILKIFVFNKEYDAVTTRKIRRAYKVFKYCFKIIMLFAIIMGIITAFKLNFKAIGVIISTLISNLFFFLFLYFDTWLIIRKRRKVKDRNSPKTIDRDE